MNRDREIEIKKIAFAIKMLIARGTTSEGNTWGARQVIARKTAQLRLFRKLCAGFGLN